MLCLSGFGLYSRWVPLALVRVAQMEGVCRRFNSSTTADTETIKHFK